MPSHTITVYIKSDNTVKEHYSEYTIDAVRAETFGPDTERVLMDKFHLLYIYNLQ
jgi:hypothetical protein